MNTVAKIGSALILASVGLVGVESMALAACPPTPPAVCASGRELRGWQAGVATGASLVKQIWMSAAVAQDPDNWELFKEEVTTVIPGVVTSLPQGSQYVKCRTQGLLESTTCTMIPHNPGPQCAFDGFDWGNISAAVYCQLSEDLGGLANVEPWYIRPVPGMCEDKFQTWCEDTYRYVATNTSDPFEATHVPPYYPDGDPQCVPYTQATFADVFNNSVYVDCSYNIPPAP